MVLRNRFRGPRDCIVVWKRSLLYNAKNAVSVLQSCQVFLCFPSDSLAKRANGRLKASIFETYDLCSRTGSWNIAWRWTFLTCGRAPHLASPLFLYRLALPRPPLAFPLLCLHFALPSSAAP